MQFGLHICGILSFGVESDAKQKEEAGGGAKNGRHIGRGVCIFSYAMFVVEGFFSYLGGGSGGRRSPHAERGLFFSCIHGIVRFFRSGLFVILAVVGVKFFLCCNLELRGGQNEKNHPRGV